MSCGERTSPADAHSLACLTNLRPSEEPPPARFAFPGVRDSSIRLYQAQQFRGSKHVFMELDRAGGVPDHPIGHCRVAIFRDGFHLASTGTVGEDSQGIIFLAFYCQTLFLEEELNAGR